VHQIHVLHVNIKLHFTFSDQQFLIILEPGSCNFQSSISFELVMRLTKEDDMYEYECNLATLGWRITRIIIELCIDVLLRVLQPSGGRKQ